MQTQVCTSQEAPTSIGGESMSLLFDFNNKLDWRNEKMNIWYEQLLKPDWAPPPWLFGPVWTVLYIVIIITFGKTILMLAKSKINFMIFLPFLLNIVFNIAFTPLQFGLQNNLLAFLDIILILLTLVWAMVAIYKYVPWVTFANIPYLLWVSFATVLQAQITLLNF